MTEMVRFLSEWIAVQAAPGLAEKVGFSLDLPEERMIYGMPLDESLKTLKDYDGALRKLMGDHGFSWWDVYRNSDVGKERLALAEEMGVDRDDVILDVGCGRGYTTMALATACESVCGLDLMNGLGRRGWWEGFMAAMEALGLDGKVSGQRASASEIPFRNDTFSLTVSAHAIRNFGERSIVGALSEMHRVTREGGRVIVAENLPVARRKSQEAYLKMYESRTRFVSGDRPFYTGDELVRMFLDAGLPPTRTEVLDLDFSATPSIFVPDFGFLSEREREKAEREYATAVEMIREHGESSPPVLIVEATVE